MKKALLLVTFLAAAPAWAIEWVRATVESTDPKRNIVVLDHARIKSLPMEAMTMPFKVKDRALLKGLKPGDKVRFTVGAANDELVVTRIKVVK